MTGRPLNQTSVLIVSDDTEFARTVAARWRAERQVPEITLATSDVWHAGSALNYELVIVGPVREGKSPAILSSLDVSRGTASVYVTEDTKDVSMLRAEHPNLLVVPRQDGWIGTLILISSEALRRVDAVERGRRA